MVFEKTVKRSLVDFFFTSSGNESLMQWQPSRSPPYYVGKWQVLGLSFDMYLIFLLGRSLTQMLILWLLTWLLWINNLDVNLFLLTVHFFINLNCRLYLFISSVFWRLIVRAIIIPTFTKLGVGSWMLLAILYFDSCFYNSLRVGCWTFVSFTNWFRFCASCHVSVSCKVYYKCQQNVLEYALCKSAPFVCIIFEINFTLLFRIVRLHHGCYEDWKSGLWPVLTQFCPV